MLKAKLLHHPKEEDGASTAFGKILDLIKSAQKNIAIHMYVWRSDEIGNKIGEALIQAADRGVKVNIIKDQSAMMYERIEMNRKSYLPREPTALKQLWWKAISPTFPNTFIKDEFLNGAGQKLIDHAQVNLRWVEETHTHQKYYLFDDQHLVTGSINIEDRHKNYFDYMVHLEEKELGNHFRSRKLGLTPYDLNRDTEFIFNQTMNKESRFEIKPLLIRLLNNAKREIHIEVAYIGDPEVNRAIVAASNRGIQVHLLLSERANIGNDNNYRAAEEIMLSSSVRVFLTPKMIHAKMIAFDRETVFSGSANISIFSMCNSGELNLFIKQPELVKNFLSVADARTAASKEVTDPRVLGKYNRPIAFLQDLHQKLKL